MGSQLCITWSDGPLAMEVANLTDAYTGRFFDAMCDGHYQLRSWLDPDGLAVRAETGDAITKHTIIPRPTDRHELVLFEGSRAELHHK